MVIIGKRYIKIIVWFLIFFFSEIVKLGMSFNLEKAQIMYIGKRKITLNNNNLNNFSISQVKNITFLGRCTSSGKSMNDHYNKVKEKIESGIALLKILNSFNNSLHPKEGLNCYKMFVRSVIEYGRTSTCNFNKTLDKKIERLQNSYLRRALGVVSC